MVGAPFFNSSMGAAYALFFDDNIQKPVEGQTFWGPKSFGFNELDRLDHFGHALTSSSADVDGDSHDDLVIVAQDSGEVFLFWGNVISLLRSNKSYTSIDLRFPRPLGGGLAGCEGWLADGGGGEHGIVCEGVEEKGVQYTKVEEKEEGGRFGSAIVGYKGDLDGNGVNELMVGDDSYNKSHGAVYVM